MTGSFYVKSLVLVTKGNEEIEPNDVGVVTRIEVEHVEVFFVGKQKKVKLEADGLHIINPSETGDSYDSKVCNKCHKLLEIKEFDLNQNGKNNRPVRRPSCKQCRKEIDGVSIPSADKKFWESLKPKNEVFECPICSKVTIAGVTSKVVLNHDHGTGVPSGWICDSCNTGLGRFKDDPEILRNAIRYLEEAKKSQE